MLFLREYQRVDFPEFCWFIHDDEIVSEAFFFLATFLMYDGTTIERERGKFTRKAEFDWRCFLCWGRKWRTLFPDSSLSRPKRIFLKQRIKYWTRRSNALRSSFWIRSSSIFFSERQRLEWNEPNAFGALAPRAPIGFKGLEGDERSSSRS